ncbi:DUF4407 domain-containing protein [Actinoplanes sichuanensis]|uniref:DUF4407 domain-containing protein n=1 Tax=Actinoplanes sichuanensis TaxID=512349 RepID=A0ABW4A0L9_9ACTN|nr:DUF4407 domain-containing protein [Actinoplanes sichuanensis]BEL04348.1 DUF4407 domain-containing protein [Actinoplanes sichuanensis]
MTTDTGPAAPDRGPGRLLRRFTGVDESLLDWVPQERPRYSRLGAIVLNTGLMAAFSLLVALQSVVDVPVAVLIPVALAWGLFIVTFDGWLVATTHGVGSYSRFPVLLPRLLVSLLLGSVIAEPLVLWVFRPAIDAEIMTQRVSEQSEYESRLRLCNSTSGETANPACAGYLLNVASADPIRDELTRTSAQRATVSAEITRYRSAWSKLQETAKAECAGTGSTGRAGEGPACKQLRAEADRYLDLVKTEQTRLNGLDSTILRLNTALGDASEKQEQQTNVAIASRVAEWRAADGQIGLLDRAAALTRLGERSGAVMAAQWLLRMLFILIDCLPVLTAFLGRGTTYDQLLSRRLTTARLIHDQKIDLRERQEAAELALRVRKAEAYRRREMDDLDAGERSDRAAREAGVDEQIEALAARLRGDPVTWRVPPARPKRAEQPGIFAAERATHP